MNESERRRTFPKKQKHKEKMILSESEKQRELFNFDLIINLNRSKKIGHLNIDSKPYKV